MASAAELTEFDNSLRLYTYRQVVATGKAPTVAQAATARWVAARKRFVPPTLD